MKPLLICHDGSQDAAEAARVAGEVFPRAEAVVLHVWEPLSNVASVPPVPGLSGALKGGLDEMDRQGEAASHNLVQEAAETCRQAGLQADPLSRRAKTRAWRTILAVADDCDASVIVMGRRGLSGMERALLGSVSNAVLHHADRPVLIVPPRPASE